MTDIQRFNLYWLCHAMTVPVASKELYYYDGFTRKFFAERSGILFDMVDLPIHDSAELAARLTGIDAEAWEIVEIPRLNVQDKVSVQLLFLSNFPGVIHEEKLRSAVEKQTDGNGFLLDRLLGENEVLEPMVQYWDEFKLKTIQHYLDKYTGIIGITLKMI